MRRELHAAALAGVFLAAAAPAAAQTYAYDDGEADVSIGLGEIFDPPVVEGDLAWFQHFDTDDKALAIDLVVEVLAVNGSSLSGGAEPGSSGGVAVYQAPNGDMDPRDLDGSHLLATATWIAMEEGSDTFERTLLCPNATVQGPFWVCAWLHHDLGETPAPIDTDTASNGRSWFTATLDAFDPTNPNATTFFSLENTPLDGVWLLRANHEPTVIHVDADATGENDGTSWEDAFWSLQDALCRAHAGDEVWVAEGDYRPDEGIAQAPGNRAESFHTKTGVSVYGGFEGNEGAEYERDWTAHPTVLTGDLAGDDESNFQNRGENSHVVVRSSSEADETDLLDGFVVRGGNATGGSGNDRGGGMVAAGSPTVRNCLFDECEGSRGGALAVYGEARVTDCVFWHNFGNDMGGAIIVQGGSLPRIQDCTFYRNMAIEGAGIAVLGASAPTLANCLLSGNKGAFSGGIAVLEDSSLQLYNSTLASNFTAQTPVAQGGGVYVGPGSSAVIANSILYWNTDYSGSGESSQIYADGSVAVDYSCIQGLTGALGGSGNIGDDPLFMDVDGPDDFAGTQDDELWLRQRSPCIDAGLNALVPPWLEYDLRGDHRILIKRVDMGAYESFKRLQRRGLENPIGPGVIYFY